MFRKTPSLSAIAAAVVLAACATTATPPAELVSAREVVRSAELDPNVLTYAQLELKRATDALQRANELNARGERLSDIASAAYVAEQHAQAALAIARAKGNEEAIKRAETDRERARADARAAEADRAREQAARARADAEAARSQASSAQAQASAAQIAASDAEARAAAAREQAAREAAAAAAAQEQASRLQRELVVLQAQQTDRGMLVTLGDVLFEFGRAELKPNAATELRKLANYLKEHPERKILVEGHTDSVGSDAANVALSQRRADAVARELAAMGVGADRIAVRGYGESYPVADNRTDTNRALNRRVEVYVSNDSSPVRARG